MRFSSWQNAYGGHTHSMRKARRLKNSNKAHYHYICRKHVRKFKHPLTKLQKRNIWALHHRMR